MFTKEEIFELNEFSKETRKNIIKMVYNAKSGHPGGSLSSVDILNVLIFRKNGTSLLIMKKETDLFCPKGMLRRFYIQYWRKKDSLSKKSC